MAETERRGMGLGVEGKKEKAEEEKKKKKRRTIPETTGLDEHTGPQLCG